MVFLIWNVILLKCITPNNLKTVFSLKYKGSTYEYHAKEGEDSSLLWCSSWFHINRLKGTWHDVATSDPAWLNPQYPKLKQSFHNGPGRIPKLSQTQDAFAIWTNQHLMFRCIFSGITLCFKQQLSWQMLWLRKKWKWSAIMASLAQTEKKTCFFLLCCVRWIAWHLLFLGQE